MAKDYFSQACNSFEGFTGAEVPKNPTNDTEFLALKPTGGDPKVWSGTVPAFDQITAKMAELKKADEDLIETKKSAYKKNGLTDEEIAAIL